MALINLRKYYLNPDELAKMILGEPFELGKWEDIYKYTPSASNVKLETQKTTETQEDIQLIQITASINNPNMPKILNKLYGNIFRNRNMPAEAAYFDEDFYEPQSDAGNLQMLKRMMAQGEEMPSNQNQMPMSQPEKQVRQGMYEKPKMVS